MDHKYYTYEYPHPAVTTDNVIFGFDGKSLKVLLIERGIEPYKGCWAFPGGFVRIDETVEQCALRELREETGLESPKVEQFHTFSDVYRDPRERVITVAFFALVKLSEVKGGDDAASAQWFDLKSVPHLAFDHDYILRLALRTLKERIHFEPIGFELLDEEFSMPDLQRLYEAVLEVKFDRRNFEKKMLFLGIIDKVPLDGEDDSDDADDSDDVEEDIFKERDLFSEVSNSAGHNEDVRFSIVSAPAPPVAQPRCNHRPRGKNRKFRFNKEKYDKMKEKGIFKIEF